MKKLILLTMSIFISLPGSLWAEPPLKKALKRKKHKAGMKRSFCRTLDRQELRRINRRTRTNQNQDVTPVFRRGTKRT